MFSLGHSVGVLAINLYANKWHPVAKATLSSGETAYHVVFFFLLFFIKGSVFLPIVVEPVHLQLCKLLLRKCKQAHCNVFSLRNIN